MYFPSKPLWLGLNLIITALLLAGGIQAKAAAPEGYVAREFKAPNGEVLPYRLLIPEPCEAGRTYPLILFFHGAGERGTDNLKQLIHGTSLFLEPANRKAFPCFVVAPQCPDNQQWVDMPWGADSGTRPSAPSASMKLALKLVDELERTFAIDTNRLYVTGLSMGGFATWDCITRFPDRFAAGIPICGGGDDTTITPSVARVPVWAFHSEDDTVVKVHRTRTMIEAMKKAGGKPLYTEYSGLGHNSWDSAYKTSDLLLWLFDQRLGQPDSYGTENPR